MRANGQPRDGDYCCFAGSGDVAVIMFDDGRPAGKPVPTVMRWRKNVAGRLNEDFIPLAEVHADILARGFKLKPIDADTVIPDLPLTQAASGGAPVVMKPEEENDSPLRKRFLELCERRREAMATEAAQEQVRIAAQAEAHDNWRRVTAKYTAEFNRMHRRGNRESTFQGGSNQGGSKSESVGKPSLWGDCIKKY